MTETAAFDPSPARGIFWMLVTGLCFVAVTALVKVVGPGVPPAQSAFLRYVLGLVFLVPLLPRLMRVRLGRRVLALFGLRGLVHALGVMLWFFAMTRIPIAEVTAINYLNPIYVTVMAVLLLGEKVALPRVLAIAVALAGALIILRPGFRELNAGHLAMLVTSMLFAVSYLVAKILSGTVEAAVVVAMLSVTVTIGLAPFALAVWVTPTWAQLGWLFGVAFFATAGHFTMTLAFRAAPLAVTQPVTFLQLVWATLLGLLFFGEPADGWVMAGGATIIGAISFISWREAIVRRRAVTPAEPQTKG